MFITEEQCWLVRFCSVEEEEGMHRNPSLVNLQLAWCLNYNFYIDIDKENKT